MLLEDFPSGRMLVQCGTLMNFALCALIARYRGLSSHTRLILCAGVDGDDSYSLDNNVH